jgi:hypothetical protein
MAFEPNFMKRLDEFKADQNRIRTIQDWIAFTKKWFPRDQWPQKSKDQLAAESKSKMGPVSIGGRMWNYTFWSYDLTPESRYEYFWTIKKVGDPIRFPHEQYKEKRAENGWRQECPYCEISTDELGEATCPICARKLIYVGYAD